MKTHRGKVPPLSALLWTVSRRVKSRPERISVKDALGITVLLMRGGTRGLVNNDKVS